MVEWEYKLIHMVFVSLTQKQIGKKIEELEKLFNKLSKEGWELFTRNNTALCATLYIFRRKRKK